jgi:hypothetical protein
VKICSRCKEEKEESDFNKKTGKRLQPYCKNCQHINHSEWYEKNKENRQKRIYERKKEITRWLSTIKEEKKLECSICGENRLPVLDFHHRNSEEKDYNIHEMANRGFSRKNILKEIEKCDVVCSNCHRMLHYNERKK